LPTEGHLSFLPQDETAVTTKANTRINLNFFINNLINSSKIKEYLANKELSTYLQIANTVGNQTFILKYKAQLGDFTQFIAEQNKLAPKFKSKLPQLYNAGGFLSSRALEQCTAETVAAYKAQLIKGKKILTLAAGIGIDDMALSKVCETLIGIDNDEDLNTLAIYNFERMGIRNIQRITKTAEDFLQTITELFDAVYIDPDRREGTQRQLLLAEHQPNVITLLPQLLRVANHVWIKCSPLYDIDMAVKELEGISEIYCISERGEVKEMLLHITKNNTDEPVIHCTDIGATDIKSVAFTQFATPETSPALLHYFYEAGASLVKARRHHTYAASLGLKLLDKTVPFYTADIPHRQFMGKCMAIKASFPVNPKQIKLYLKAEGIHQINLKARGVKTDTTQLLKAIGVKEGGEDFLFLLPLADKTMAVHCTPL
jgi:hypothetical protein